jgi:hypothetical protein
MASHQEIEQRSLRLAQAVARKIDHDPGQLELVREWARHQSSSGVREWLGLLDRPWEQIRAVLLQEDEEGKRLRQSSPFVGILTPQERWSLYRD